MSARFRIRPRSRDQRPFQHLLLSIAIVTSCLLTCISRPARCDEGRVTDDAASSAISAQASSLETTEALELPVEEPLCAFPRPQDQLWLVNTRQLGYPGCEPPEITGLDVRRYDPQSGWQASDVDSLLAAQHALDMTCVYVHGNRVEWSEAIGQGRGLYRRLAFGSSDTLPLCFVIWSWPSSQISGQLRDVRVKAQRTNADGYYLGWLLARFAPDRPTSLIGYSFGCRVITGALHLRGGGSLAGRRLTPGEPTFMAAAVPDEQTDTDSGSGEASEEISEDDFYSTSLSDVATSSSGKHAPARAILLAAALHDHWLSPGHAHGLAASQMDHLLLYYNSCDRVLKRYGLVEQGSHPGALGYAGLVYRTELAPDQIEQRDVCCIVGKAHDESRYYASSSLMRRIRFHALWQDMPVAP